MIGVDGTGLHKVTAKSGYPQCPAWSSISRLAFQSADHTVAIVQAGNGLTTFAAGGCPVWSPDGRRIAAPTSTGIDLRDDNGAHPTDLTIVPNSNSTFFSVAWSGDGGSLASVGADDGNHLYVIRANGSGLKKLL